MATINEQMIVCYCFIDDYLKAHPDMANWRRSANSHPDLSDAEVLTIALMQGSFGVATLKKTYLLIANNYRSAFPKLCSYKQWLARLNALGEITGHLVEAARNCEGFEANLFILDSKPIPVCHPIRHGRVRLLREDGAYFGKTSKGWFFGFKLHVMVNISGHIVGAFLTSGNKDDREAALDLALHADGGIVLGDYGYRSQGLAQELATEADMLIVTTADAGRKKPVISSIRERVETVFSQLWQLFVDRVFSRSWQGLWNAIRLKLLWHNLRHVNIISA